MGEFAYDFPVEEESGMAESTKHFFHDGSNGVQSINGHNQMFPHPVVIDHTRSDDKNIIPAQDWIESDAIEEESAEKDTEGASSAFNYPTDREPELIERTTERFSKLNMSVDTPDSVSSHKPIAANPLISSLRGRPTNAQESLHRRLSYNLEAVPDAPDNTPRRLSTSTRHFSRFFPATPTTGLSTRAIPWASSQSTDVFSSSNSPVSTCFAEETDNLTLSGAPLKNIDEDAARQRTTSAGSFGSWASHLGHPSERWQPRYEPRSHSAGAIGNQDIALIGNATLSYDSSAQTTRLMPDLSFGFDPLATPILRPSGEDYSVSPVALPSWHSDFFRPGGKALISSDSAPEPRDVLASTGSDANSNTFGLMPTLPKLTTENEGLKQYPEINDVHYSLPQTSPAPSWSFESTNWRNSGLVIQSMGGEANGSYTQCVTPSPFSMGHTNAILTPQLAGPQATASFPSILSSGTSQVATEFKPAPPSAFVSATPRAWRRPFMPMTHILFPRKVQRPLSDEERVSRKQVGVSPNYQGNPLNPKNRSADIPDSENCSLFLTNLPAQCSYQELLQALAFHRPGRIWSTYINRPRAIDPTITAAIAAAGPVSTAHLPASFKTSAAKVIFYHPHEAQRLLAAAARGDLLVGRRRAAARWNRHKTAAAGTAHERTSRVLTIAGPAAIVREDRLRSLFARYFEYHSESVVVLAEAEGEAGEGWRVLEWRFASMRAQAHAAFQLLQSLYPDVLDVRYGVDPCAGYLVMEEE